MGTEQIGTSSLLLNGSTLIFRVLQISWFAGLGRDQGATWEDSVAEKACRENNDDDLVTQLFAQGLRVSPVEKPRTELTCSQLRALLPERAEAIHLINQTPVAFRP